MKTLIIDSSIIVKWLNKMKEQNLFQADKILQQSHNNEVDLLAPELAKYEVGNVLIKKGITTEEAEVSLNTLYSVPITFVTESLDIAEQTYNISNKFGISYYDASFLSLAKLYKATLVTENIKHQGKAKDIKVVALKDY